MLKVKRPLGSRDWSVYDVGGSRTQRASWMSFFEDGKQATCLMFKQLTYVLSAVNAIVFLAPLSAFNQRLEELPSVNRLEDSLLLWKGKYPSSKAVKQSDIGLTCPSFRYLLLSSTGKSPLG
jgi:guanine nucleotide-binding protein subunit alpha